MKLTPFGIRSLVFFGVMLMAYFGAPYANLFFLLMGFLAVMWTLVVFWTWRNLQGVRAELDGFAPVMAGSSAVLNGRLFASGRARFGVGCRLDLRDGMGIEGQVAVLKGERRVRLECPELPRGVYPLDSAYLTSTYPFGLLRRRIGLAVGGELVVYPKPTEGARGGRSAEDLFLELLGNGLAGKGDLQPSGLRDHRTGDALRNVNWKASARRGKLVIQEWDGGADSGMEVLLDRRCSPAELEQALGELSALVGLARESKQVLLLRSQGMNGSFGEGHGDWAGALRFLAGAEVLPRSGPEPPVVSPEVLRLPRGLVHA